MTTESETTKEPAKPDHGPNVVSLADRRAEREAAERARLFGQIARLADHLK